MNHNTQLNRMNNKNFPQIKSGVILPGSNESLFGFKNKLWDILDDQAEVFGQTASIKNIFDNDRPVPDSETSSN